MRRSRAGASGDGIDRRGRVTGGGVVLLWSVDLADPARPDLERLREVLDAPERARLDALRPPAARLRFAAARVALRTVLGSTVGREPAALVIGRGASGKPRLERSGPDGPGSEGPAFNLAHSGDVAAVAVGGGAELGVDVELRRPVPRLEAMIRYACTAAERAALARVDDAAERAERFLESWVRKEAVLKATGRGLREHPAKVEVGRGDRVAVRGEPAPVHVRSMRCLGHPAALARIGGPCTVEVRRFEWVPRAVAPRT